MTTTPPHPSTPRAGKRATPPAAGTERTAAQRYDAFLAVCPSRQLLARISDKWVTLVLCALAGEAAPPAGDDAPAGPRALRYSQLSRLLVGVSQKMLTQTLRSLEADGLVTRSVVPTVPVTVTYELTDLGASLHRVVGLLRAWAQDNMDAVTAHRAGHGEGPADPAE
ncbi:winged helix-turn-helix transcriptional regulator [Kineococcus aurantiacus]|uniref:DNA-binding HxlR family transcriptional regulator n=1 Tax=Kineococcus aurantiacus TaxID=37633 RepID=A0A7Y9DJ70_9ACTN|nr:DNA-binding HxlR family transcriptional regulator [Kineococcus aurantiacus]